MEVEDDMRGDDDDDSTRLEALLIEIVGKHSASMSEIKAAANQKSRAWLYSDRCRILRTDGEISEKIQRAVDKSFLGLENFVAHTSLRSLTVHPAANIERLVVQIGEIHGGTGTVRHGGTHRAGGRIRIGRVRISPRRCRARRRARGQQAVTVLGFYRPWSTESRVRHQSVSQDHAVPQAQNVAPFLLFGTHQHILAEYLSFEMKPR